MLKQQKGFQESKVETHSWSNPTERQNFLEDQELLHKQEEPIQL
tara:strand:- start:263 stop:394 length:132 start_codon:yes stop_codon:yes gene_type:complete